MIDPLTKEVDRAKNQSLEIQALRNQVARLNQPGGQDAAKVFHTSNSTVLYMYLLLDKRGINYYKRTA